MGKVMTVQTFTAHGRPSVLAALHQASDLLDRHPVSARPPWLSCWIKAFDDWEPVGVTLRRDGGVVGFACLAFRRRGPLTDATLVGDGVSDYGHLTAVDDAAQRQLARRIAEVVGARKGPWRLSFDQLPAGDPIVDLLADSLPFSVVEPADPSPLLVIGEPRTLEANTHKRLRHEFRRATRRVADHRLDMDTLTGPSAIRSAWPPLEAMARCRDHSVGRKSHLDDRQWQEFYRLVMGSLAERGEIAVHTLRLDGQVIHYMVVLRDRGTWRMWDSKMDPEYASIGPGHLMYGCLIEMALADPGVSALDWQRGNSWYKSRASSGARESVRLRAYSGPWARAWFRTCDLVRGYARRTLPAPVKRALRGDLDPLVAGVRRWGRRVSPAGRGRSASEASGAAPALHRKSGAERDSRAGT